MDKPAVERERKRPGSIRVRLLQAFVPLVLASTVVVTAASVAVGLRNARGQVFDRLESIATLKQAEAELWLHGIGANLRIFLRGVDMAGILAAYPAGTPDRAAFDALGTYLVEARAYEELFLMDLDGLAVLSTAPGQEGKIHKRQGYFTDGLAGLSVCPPFYHPPTARMVVIASCPVTDGSGTVLGVLAGRADIGTLDRIMDERAGLGLTGETFLVGANHVLVAGSQAARDDESLVRSGGANSAVDARTNGSGLYVNHRGRPVAGAYRWLPDIQVGLLAEMDQAEAFGPLYATAAIDVVVGLATVAAAVLAALAIARGLTRPLAALATTATRIADGALELTAPVVSDDETGTLARAFNSMTERLRAMIGHLESSVADRTKDLERRLRYLETASQVGRAAVSILETDLLLGQIVDLIGQKFGLYHAGIFLLDGPSAKFTVGTGERGRLIRERGLQLSIENSSMIGWCIANGRDRVAQDVDEDPLYRSDPLLPDTRSEAALPLIARGNVIGALDVQSDRAGAFPDDFVNALQILADQVAVAVHNASLFLTAETARAEAERANRLKSSFLASMSHELRTPLNAVINFAYLLALGTEGPVTPEQQAMLARIEGTGRNLLGLINDILDLAKIEAGRLEIAMAPLDLPPLVDEVLATAAALVRGKPVQLASDLPRDLPTVQADRNRIRQILFNLVSNAARFTDRGSITIAARTGAPAAASASAVGDGWVTVSVRDTGIGMKPEDVPEAFSEFVQLEGARTRDVGGTGLGLPICRRLVEMHGGTIWVDSEPGAGSTFSFTLRRES